MYKTANGWTKEKMKAQIRLKNNGTQAFASRACGCVYRTETGNACAIGCFIPDDSLALNHLGTVKSLLVSHPDLKRLMPLAGGNALSEFQEVHDSPRPTGSLHEALFAWIDANVEDA